MADRKLQELESGLIKLTYVYHGKRFEELALKLPKPFSYEVNLPNDVLGYKFFLENGMTASSPNPGLDPIGPFRSYEVRDEHIEGVSGRVVTLVSSFCEHDTNFNPLLIACDVPAYRTGINLLKKVLSESGFNVDSSKWDDYKAWEEEMLKTFK